MMGCVMLSKVFKLSALGVVVFLGGYAQQASAGIPVYCFSCDDTVKNVGHSILDGIRNQTEAILNAENYSVKAAAKVALAQDVALLKTERAIANAKTYEPTLTKPSTACASYKAANLRGAISGGATGEVKKALLAINSNHNLSSAQLSDTEPKREYFVTKIIERMYPDKKDEGVSSAKLVLSEPIPEGKLAETLEEVAFLSNPFPLDTPSLDALEHIKKRGSTGDQDSMARALISIDRTARAQAVLSDEVKRDAQLYDTSTILEEYVKKINAAGTDEQRKLLKGKLSANQIDEVMATYRVRSPDWVSGTVASEEILAVREQALIQAEILNQLWEIKTLLRDMKKMQAWSDVQNTVQSGPTKQ